MQRNLILAFVLTTAFSSHCLCQTDTSSSKVSLSPGPSVVWKVDGVRTNDPVRVLDLYIPGRIRSQRVPPDQSFEAPIHDWLAKAVVEARNISKKTITSLWVNVFFPESSDGRDSVGEQVHIGGLSSFQRTKRDGTELQAVQEKQIAVSGGDLLGIPLLQNAESTEALLESRGVDHVSSVLWRIAIVYFSDGTRWSPGVFEREGQVPGVYTRITPNEFYAITISSR